MGKGAEPAGPPGEPLPPNLHWFTNREALRTLSSGFLRRPRYKGKMDYLLGIGKWFDLQLFFPPQRRGRKRGEPGKTATL